MNASAEHIDLSGLPPDLADALRYGAVAVVVGPASGAPEPDEVQADEFDGEGMGPRARPRSRQPKRGVVTQLIEFLSRPVEDDEPPAETEGGPQ